MSRFFCIAETKLRFEFLTFRDFSLIARFEGITERNESFIYNTVILLLNTALI